mgnify:CR=1 FL=1
MTTKREPDGKLTKAMTLLIRPVTLAKEREPHLDEMDEAEPILDSATEALFDDPSNPTGARAR